MRKNATQSPTRCLSFNENKLFLLFFSRMFEFTASIPVVKDLKIAVMDYDLIGRDDLIGETQIDLEQRMLSRYFATCGFSKTYCK